jgi:hypothetical protein
MAEPVWAPGTVTKLGAPQETVTSGVTYANRRIERRARYVRERNEKSRTQRPANVVKRPAKARRFVRSEIP